jgi:DNA-binding NtrC family response regulator
MLRDKDTVDLALIDLVMPGMDGRRLATRIRASDPQQKILFMTRYDDLSGTDDPFTREMLKKPFKLVELAAAVERALGEDNREQPPWSVTPIRSPKTKDRDRLR